MRVVLSFISNDDDMADSEERYEWASDDAGDKKLNNMTAYLTSHPIYFITDERLFKGGRNGKEGETLESHIQTFLQELATESEHEAATGHDGDLRPHFARSV